MTSQINPNNINGAYPVAGQDNNSQGFRDNFTNTSTNFQFAAQEITALQNSAVLNSQISGGANLTVQNNMLNSPLTNALIADFALTGVSLGTLSGTVPINYISGHYQTVTTGGSISLAFSNWPIAGQVGIVSVAINVTNTAYTVTLPAAVSVNSFGYNGIQGLYNSNPGTASSVMSFAATGVYTFTFTTSDNGSNITMTENNGLLMPFNNSGQNLTATGQACSLATTSTKFITTSAWTATLATGVDGQIKEFIMTGNGGDMVITVAAAGWKTSGSGTMTFSALGQGCIMRMANQKWHCVGNNGVVFA
jgi:hypothetical protein